MLVNVLYLGAEKIDFLMEDPEISKLNDFFIENISEFENYFKSHGRKYLLEARWYIYENIHEKYKF